MMVNTPVVVMCLKLGVLEDDVGQVTSHSVNNTTMMQLSEAFLLDYDEEDSIGRMVSM